jgi:hypothetical protein
MAIWTIDFKSSTGVWDEMKTQSCVYLEMYNLNLISEEPATRAGVLRLDKKTGMLDDPAIVDCTEEIDRRWQEFLHLREYYRTAIEPEAKKDRWYSVNGKKYPTVTTILGILEKPALVQWSANMTVQYIRENLAELTTPDQIEYHLKKAKTAYRTISKQAMDTGSIVHDAIHCYLSGGKPESIIGDNDKATNSFLAFLTWADKVKLKPIALEKVLIDQVNEIGGTCDFIGEVTI